ncbi:Uncharacterised protein [Ralstonia pickettii]|uniref:hypothetical protein n=2 Tax=Ralstonia TaxID=48736 RepID=UPI0001E6A896|nr:MULTISPECIES: hypothetical protein [Ralstonia]MBU6523588.1 hypothetical protein [Ralstonia sp. B265]EFP64466.1 hypothetical protein HMPREF1004_03809 [Ralstonia pickettii]EGY64337.1 hypothetical protein HMPREF0989_02357 [Ralstonia sp. 5_2_56FAA]KFL24249.1 hypothetical protein DP23_3903 [Ralstonia pickettii]NPT49519.1 hypothetical protein [Ralstonia sp. 3N]
MHTEPMSVIPTTRPRRLYRVLTWLVAAAVAIGMSYARAADNAAPTCTAEAQRIRGELGNQDLPIFNDQAGRYLADALSQLYAYGTLPNRYVPERQANWEPGANRPVMMQKRSIGGDAWAQTGLLQADIDDGLSKRGPLRLIYTQDGKPQYVTTTAENAPRIPTQRCAGR